MKTIVYTCPYVPAEWIAAHGLQPRRLIPRPVEGTATIPQIEGLCPYARAFANDVAASEDVDGVVVTTMCDQMRRIFDLLVRRINVPVFLLNVPSTWQTVTARQLYLGELERFGRFLVRLGGCAPDREKLTQEIRRYSVNKELTDLYPALYPSQLPPGPLSWVWQQTFQSMGGGSERDLEGTRRVPIGVIGGPLMERDQVLFRVILECGGQIAFDGTETGDRTIRSLDDRYLSSDPLVNLARAYFHIPDPSRRPNSEFYQWLREKLASHSARGLVLHHYVWCDKWHAEFERIKEWIKLPMLRLDSEGRGEMDSPRVRNRIHAFMEALR
ncbi:MAG: 2-hydroxyacyl-CoA dehydratase family protein [Planctomycetes bacterium]|nr:2-hydroxyacyl-CoA dehydratase family protein [Planctomycetota bacterium]